MKGGLRAASAVSVTAAVSRRIESLTGPPHERAAIRLPLMPLLKVIQLGEVLRDHAEQELHNPASVRRQLEHAEQAQASGEISDEDLVKAQLLGVDHDAQEVPRAGGASLIRVQRGSDRLLRIRLQPRGPLHTPWHFISSNWVLIGAVIRTVARALAEARARMRGPGRVRNCILTVTSLEPRCVLPEVMSEWD